MHINVGTYVHIYTHVGIQLKGIFSTSNKEDTFEKLKEQNLIATLP